jgi:hypothetical protein
MTDGVRESMPANIKSGSGMGYIIIALFIGIVPELFIRWLNHVDIDQTPTQVALAELKIQGQHQVEQITELKEQVKALNEQPYVRREEFENRLAGFDRRIGEIERTKQPGHN